MTRERRRLEDWRETSPRTLDLRVYQSICDMLGYKVTQVMSIRMQDTAVVVTFRDGAGLPHAVRHEMKWS